MMSETLGEYIKSMVFGGMDGIITTFAIVCAASGASKDDATIVTMGVANLVADSISMGMGDYISERAEQDYASLKKDKVLELVRKSPKAHQEALVDSYINDRGMTKADAVEVVSRIAKYEDVLAEQIMQHVDGVEPPDDEDNAMMKGLVTAASFVIFGSVPLMIFLIKSKVDPVHPHPPAWHPDEPLVISTIASAVTMFLLGAVSGSFTEQNKVKSGLVMAAHGLFAAFSAYALGHAMEGLYGNEDSYPEKSEL